jgi:hypothetical protein
MNDAQRYRMNAAECLSAAERCGAYRGLTLAIAASWFSLVRQQIAMDELLAIWSEASSADTSLDASQWRFQYPLVKEAFAKKPPSPSMVPARERVRVPLCSR